MSRFAQHPTALVESEQIGAGTRIWAFAHVMAGAIIGPECNIGDHCFVEGGAMLGRGVTVKNHVSVWKGVHLGDYVFVGPGAVFTNDLHPRSARLPVFGAQGHREEDWLVETWVEEGAALGANATVIAGVRVGSFAMVGAGSVVTKDVAPYTLVVGNPARVRGRVSVDGHVLRPEGDDWVDPLSGRNYRFVDGIPQRCSS